MRRSPIAISIFVAVLPSAAQAWNHTGHRLSAIIAYDRLKAQNPDRAAELIAVLKQHPFFDRDFHRKMPPAVRDGSKADQDRWVFAQAAMWPDIVRSRSHPGHERHHHATWHYVNERIFLDPDDRGHLNIDSVVNRVRTWKPGMRSSKMNVVQAYQKCMKQLGDDETSRPDKAVALCWILHLVGDIHQPLHATALFSSSRFRRGDRGGNGIPVANGRSLHSLWDGLLGNAVALGTLRRNSRELLKVDRAAGEASLNEMQFGTWVDESHEIARQHVYDEGVFAIVRNGEADAERPFPRFRPSAEYMENARRIAGRRIVQAGFRLARVLGE